MKNTLLIVLIMAVSAVACKRKDIRGDLKNRRDILESANWKLSSIKDNGGPTSLPACQQDNYYVFTPGGTGRYEEGTNNCLDSTGTGNAPTFTAFKWEMTGDLRNIYFREYGGDPDAVFNWEITNMDYDAMDVTQIVTTSDKIQHKLEMVFRSIPK